MYGGRAVLPPFDAPRVRMTVISDPQGATFIASKFVPEGKDPGQESLVFEPMTASEGRSTVPAMTVTRVVLAEDQQMIPPAFAPSWLPA